jgi:polysaccharide chain length determinant protein (PEP-CTERM system associated)
MDKLLQVIRSEILSIWRFRWWAMLAAWAIFLVGYVGLSLWPDQYEAHAVVFVDASSRLDEVIGGVAIEWDVSEQLNRVKQEMLSRPVLEAVARETDLDLRVSTPQQMSMLIASLRQRISIEEVRRRVPDPRMPTDSVLTIGYKDGDRDMSLAVVQTLLNTFVGDVIRGGQGASEAAKSFLTDRIRDYEVQLAEREAALAQFKRENVGLLPGAEGDYFLRLQTSMGQVETLEADLRAAENRRDALRAQLTSENPSLPSGGATGGSVALPQDALQVKINELENTLDVLLLRFTDQHPDVQGAQQQLRRLLDQREAERAALAAAGGSEFEGSAVSTNPVYQSIQIALNEIKVEIAGIQSSITEHRRRVADLTAKVDVMPEVEARLAGLVRDYDQVKQIHDQLVGRLEQERLGTAAVTNDVNFSVMEPPVADFNPIAPNRLLILAALFVLSMGGAVGLAYLMNMLRPVFSDSRSLREYAELPVLGSISVVRSPAQRLIRRVHLATFLALGMIFVVTFAALVFLREDAASFAQSLLV